MEGVILPGSVQPPPGAKAVRSSRDSDLGYLAEKLAQSERGRERERGGGRARARERERE